MWATKESLENAAKRVGVTSSGSSVNFMLQYKFARAEACIDPESFDLEPSASSSITETRNSFSLQTKRLCWALEGQI